MSRSDRYAKLNAQSQRSVTNIGYTRYVNTFFFFFFHTHLLSSFWTSRGHRCRPFSPPGSCLRFLSRIGVSNPTACRFFIEFAKSRSRAFCESIYAQEKFPTNLYEHALGGVRTHETDLYQARG